MTTESAMFYVQWSSRSCGSRVPQLDCFQPTWASPIVVRHMSVTASTVQWPSGRLLRLTSMITSHCILVCWYSGAPTDFQKLDALEGFDGNQSVA